MKKILLHSLIAVGFICSACPSEPSSDQAYVSNTAAEQARNTSAPPEGGGGGDKDESSLRVAEASTNPVEIKERKIIRNANLRIESGSPQETQKKIVGIANANGGFILESKTLVTDDQVRNQNRFSVILQVPSDKFDSVLAEIREAGGRVLSETLKGQDVTEEFIDVEARLKAKKVLEERFLEIMKRAGSVKDALEVERELESVRTEIERIEGRRRSLENLTSLSKVTVDVIPPSAISASSTGFWYQLKDALNDGFEGALTFVLLLVRIFITLIPFLLIIVLPVLLVLRYLWRTYKRNRQARVEKEEIERLTDDIE